MSKSSHARRWITAGSGLILILGVAASPAMTASASVSGLAARGAPAAPLTAADAAQAAALASSSGQPVEVLGDRTEFSHTFAQPGGGFQDTESLVPYQVQASDGSWVPVDTTLSVQPGGVVAPAAITTGLAISDGGSGPLYTLTSGSGSLSVSWPFGPLPAPSLSGATATFAGVLPGVNLLVSATPTGVSDLIEVTSAAAAVNPALAAITFPVAGSGLSVSADAAGDLTAVDGAGNAVYSAAAPQMWDSAGQGGSGAGAAALAGVRAAGQQPGGQEEEDGPAPGDHQAVLAVAAAPGSVSLTPAASVLSGGQVVYPVFIDPEWNVTPGPGIPTWGDVWQQKVFQGDGSSGTLLSTSTGPPDWLPGGLQGIKSGVTCDTSNSANGDCVRNLPGTSYAGDTVYQTYMSYLNFPVPGDSTFAGAAYADAQLQLDEEYSWGCPSAWAGVGYVSVWDTDTGNQNHPTSSSTTWTTQPAVGNWLGSDSSLNGYSNPNTGVSCPHQVISFLPAATAQDAAANSWGKQLTLRLSGSVGDNASLNQWSWRRFAANSLQLSYYWRNAPDQPTGVGTEGTFDAKNGTTVTHCSTDPNNPDWVNSTTTTWTAAIDDRDRTSVNGSPSAANIDGEFSWQNLTNPNNPPPLADAGNPKSAGSVFTGTRAGTAGNEYQWKPYGVALQNDPWNASAPSLVSLSSAVPCYFQIDMNKPSSTAAVAVTAGNTQDYVGTQDTFTFKASDLDTPVGGSGAAVNDIVGFYYGIDNSQPSTYVPATKVSNSSSSATITLTPFTLSEIDLYVQAVDRAGWLGPLPPGNAPSYTIDAQTAQAHIATMGWWKLNTVGTDSAVPSGNTGKDMALSASGASWGCPTTAGNSPGYICSLGLDGTGYASAQPVLSNEDSFSVSAWVNVDHTWCAGQGVYCAVLSQDATGKSGGSHVSGFTLGYQPAGSAEVTYQPVSGGPARTASTQCPCWVFSMPQSNTAGDEYTPNMPGSGYYLAAAPAALGPGTWTQLTGVFDKINANLELYVNGNLAAVSPGSVQAWTSAGTGPATGAFRVGADWNGTGLTDFLTGSVSAVCAFYGVLLASDVTTLYSKGSGDGCSLMYPTPYP